MSNDADVLEKNRFSLLTLHILKYIWSWSRNIIVVGIDFVTLRRAAQS